MEEEYCGCGCDAEWIEVTDTDTDTNNTDTNTSNKALLEIYKGKGILMSNNVDVIMNDILAGRKDSNNLGDFYDKDGLRLRIILGTNCGMYWIIQCKKCNRDNNECSCGFFQQFKSLKESIHTLVKSNDNDNSTIPSSLVYYLFLNVATALKLGLVYSIYHKE